MSFALLSRIISSSVTFKPASPAPVIAEASTDLPMVEVNQVLSRYNLEYLPVVTAKNEVLGFLERRQISRKIFTKLIELEKQAESLGC
jgi:Mg/Co/Ni transporter MgtE